MLRELTSLSLNINNDTLILSSVSEADPVTGGPAYKLSPSLLLGSHIWTMGEPVITGSGDGKFRLLPEHVPGLGQIPMMFPLPCPHIWTNRLDSGATCFPGNVYPTLS